MSSRPWRSQDHVHCAKPRRPHRFAPCAPRPPPRPSGRPAGSCCRRRSVATFTSPTRRSSGQPPASRRLPLSSTLGQCTMNAVVHRLFAFSQRSLFAHGSAPPLGRAARPLAGSEPLVVRVQVLHATRVAELALSLCAESFKACTGVSRRFRQQAALVLLSLVRPTLPSSGQPRGTGFAAQGQRWARP